LGFPVEVSVNLTVSGAEPEVTSEVKPATSASVTGIKNNPKINNTRKNILNFMCINPVFYQE
jgi:hypothetical protein